jgi:hypothetical protein
MKILFWISRWLIRKIKPENSMELLSKLYPVFLERIPHEERPAFLTTLIKDNLSCSVRDMSRQERATLMNTLLPSIAKEFPLTDLDLLAAFSNPESGKQP